MEYVRKVSNSHAVWTENHHTVVALKTVKQIDVRERRQTHRVTLQVTVRGENAAPGLTTEGKGVISLPEAVQSSFGVLESEEIGAEVMQSLFKSRPLFSSFLKLLRRFMHESGPGGDRIGDIMLNFLHTLNSNFSPPDQLLASLATEPRDQRSPDEGFLEHCGFSMGVGDLFSVLAGEVALGDGGALDLGLRRTLEVLCGTELALVGFTGSVSVGNFLSSFSSTLLLFSSALIRPFSLGFASTSPFSFDFSSFDVSFDFSSLPFFFSFESPVSSCFGDCKNQTKMREIDSSARRQRCTLFRREVRSCLLKTANSVIE